MTQEQWNEACEAMRQEMKYKCEGILTFSEIDAIQVDMPESMKDDITNEAFDMPTVKAWGRGYEQGLKDSKETVTDRNWLPSDADTKHLEWIYDRLVYVYNENANYDYMIRLREIIDMRSQMQANHKVDCYKAYLQGLRSFVTSTNQSFDEWYNEQFNPNNPTP